MICIYIYYMICVLCVIMYQDTMYKKFAAWILAGVICGGYLLLAQVEFWHGSGRTWLLGTSVQCQDSHQTPCWMVKKPHIKNNQKCGPKVKKCIKVNTFEFVVLKSVHPGRLTWNPRIHSWKRKIIVPTIIFRFDENYKFHSPGRVSQVVNLHTSRSWQVQPL